MFDLSKIDNILTEGFCKEHGIPKVLIIGDGKHTYLHVNGQWISDGCTYVEYKHMPGTGSATLTTTEKKKIEEL